MAVTIDGPIGFQILLVSHKISVAFEVVGLVFFFTNEYKYLLQQSKKVMTYFPSLSSVIVHAIYLRYAFYFIPTRY